MTIALRWQEEGFSAVCEALAERAMKPSPAGTVGPTVKRWLDRQLEEAWQLAARWPGRTLRVSIVGERDAPLLLIALTPTLDEELWAASVLTRFQPTREPRLPDLRAALNSVHLQIAIAGLIEIDGLTIDEVHRHLWIDGAEQDLTPRDWRLLTALLHRPREAIDRRQLWPCISNERPFSKKEVSNYIGRLRAKLGSDGSLIAVVRSFGYRLDAGPSRNPLVIGQLRIDPVARQAWRGGTEIDFTPSEFNILSTLARRAGHVVRAEVLCDPDEDLPSSRAGLWVTIGRLRRKLEGTGVTIVVTLGEGYHLDPPEPRKPRNAH